MAAALTESRSIGVTESSTSHSEDFTKLIKVSIKTNGETIEVDGQAFNLDFADHIAFFRYEDRLGMVGRVGTIFGEAGMRIDNAVIGGTGGEGASAGLAVTSHESIPQGLIDETLKLGRFRAGHAVTLD